MPTGTYELFVDWNDDGDFGDTNEDCSANLQAVTISRGFNNPLARMPTVGRATFTLDNQSQVYNPATVANARPRREVQFDMTYGGSTETLYRGFIEAIRPMAGQRGEKRAVLECVDAIALLDLYEGSIALQTNKYADDIITLVVAACYTPPSTSYETGLNVFPTSGDRWTWQEANAEAATRGPYIETRASQKILAACTADWGRFFIAGDGEATYFNRHHMPMDSSTELTLSDTMVAMEGTMSVAEIYNYVEVTCYPRSIGTIYEVLGRISQRNAPVVNDGDTVTFNLQFRDSSNQSLRIGGIDIQTVTANTDYTITSAPGGGDDETANVTVTQTNYSDHSAVAVENDGAGHSVFVQKLRVRGHAVRAREPVTMVATDATSETSYQSRKLRINAPLMSTPADAQGLANYLLDYYKDPRDDIRGVQFCANRDATLLAAARDLELMDRVDLTETQTGHSNFIGHAYWIHHSITNAGTLHMVTMNLEKPYALGGTPFTIDTSLIDGTDIIVY